MAKIVPNKKVGVPVPADIPADVKFLTCYFGPAGFTPDYASEDQVDVPFADLQRTTVNGADYFVFDTSALPALQNGQSYDLYFTLADEAGNENDFSPKVELPPLDQTPPPALGQPILL